MGASTSGMLQQTRAMHALVALVNRHFLELPDEGFVAWARSGAHRGVLAALAEAGAEPPRGARAGDGAEGAALEEVVADGESDVAEAAGADDDAALDAQARLLVEGTRLMLAFVDAHDADGVDALMQTLGVDRTRLYRGVTPGYSPPYPAEGVWLGQDDRRAARLFEELTVLYRENGVQMAHDANERPDYIGVQLEFVRHMLSRQIEALERGDEDAASACAEAVASFAEKHLAWLPAFIEKARPMAETDFYRGHLMMLEGVRRELLG